jgi:pyruvate/2-oxoglutarate dehydrogenase complex dihydrolipoamide dehydrogenase (E3) component
MIAAARAAKGFPAALRPREGSPAPALDFQGVTAHVRSVIADIAPTDSSARFAALGVEIIKDEARFVDRSTVAAGGKLIKARRFIIAAGSKPDIPALVGLDTVPYLTNETVFDLADRPAHLMIVGAGPMGCELGQAFRRLGSDVTMFEVGSLLPREDEELAGLVRVALNRDGVALHENVRLTAAAAIGGIRLHYSDAASRPKEINGTHLLIATGRRPEISDLDLEAGWIKYDKDGIIVDHGMRTSNPRVFAIGDCAGGAAGGYRFTHAAASQASLVIRRALFRMPVRFEPTLLPRVTYTDPEIAAVGLSEGEARTKHGHIRILRFPFSENDRARTQGETEGLVKVIASPKGRILGAAICGKGAGEMISLWALALQERMKLSKIAGLAVPYPTLSEASRRAAMEFYVPLARRPLVRRILGFLRRLG